jgi:hypothetical protein
MKLTWAVISGVFCLAIAGCGSSDSSSSDPVATCNSAAEAICDKYYGCFTQAQLAASADVVGNNKADCVTKFEGESCTTEKVKCDSGQTYQPDKGTECVSQVKALSCSEFQDPNTATPAACTETCK